MLTSSDAKWRCMWHMLVWSILLTLVSQYLPLANHIALYIFAAFCMILLPVITAIYSNTSGRHGSGLIRVAYVICDPVLACITITPVLVLNSLPRVVSRYTCLVRYDSWNVTCECLHNRSFDDSEWYNYGPDLTPDKKMKLQSSVLGDFFIIQISITIPILLSLLMGRRTSKMSINTYILTFAYWFVTAIELVDMIETIRLGDIYHNVIFTTGAIITITIIITNSYAIVTLCSFISPQTGRIEDKPRSKFDLVYKIIVAGSAVLFTEIPLVVARFQMLSADVTRMLPATFYLWWIKDFLFLCLIIFTVLSQKFFKKTMVKIPCKVKFDNTDIIFQPEKRDEYIISKKTVTFQDPPATTFGELPKVVEVCIDKPGDRQRGLTLEGVKKIPNSVLKNSSCLSTTLTVPGALLERSNSGQLTDLSTRKASAHLDNSSLDLSSSAKSSNSSIKCLPLTDLASLSSSRSSSPGGVIGGARPKVITNGDHSNNDIREIKSRPSKETVMWSGSDSDSLV